MSSAHQAIRNSHLREWASSTQICGSDRNMIIQDIKRAHLDSAASIVCGTSYYVIALKQDHEIFRYMELNKIVTQLTNKQ